MARRKKAPSVHDRLAELFRRNGYTRHPNADRQATDGHQRYKKGYEVRLVGSSQEELGTIRLMLLQAGFTPGRAFRKGRQYRQPIYGREQVERFLAMVDGRGDT